MKILVFFLILQLFFTADFLSQNNTLKRFHPFSDKVIFSGELGFTHSYTDYRYPRPELLTKASIEYYFPSKSIHAFGIKVIGGLGKITSHSTGAIADPINPNFRTSLFYIGGGITYAREWGYSIPYLSATFSQLRINPKNRDGDLLPNNLNRKYILNLSMYTAEFGIRFMVQNYWSFNLGLNMNFTNSDYLDDIKFKDQNDKFLTLFFGISLYHGGDNDSDKDGIQDSKDVCPNTPSNIIVNEFGCPKDSDTDGVPDYLDECPKTPKNILIDDNGCPLDLNTNGTPDYLESNKIISEISEKDSVTTEVLNNDLLKNDLVLIDSVLINDFVAKDHTVYNISNEKMLSDLFFTDGQLYCFQVGSFKDKDPAQKLLQKLIYDGHEAYIIKANPFKDEQVWFRVRIGYFNNLAEAKKYKAKLSE